MENVRESQSNIPHSVHEGKPLKRKWGNMTLQVPGATKSKPIKWALSLPDAPCISGCEYLPKLNLSKPISKDNKSSNKDSDGTCTQAGSDSDISVLIKLQYSIITEFQAKTTLRG